MKPKVFLSHSKKDQEFIKELDRNLRPARIDVWYDDWEIPPGASLRSKIFEEGISECDLFFIYLTKNSKDSYWVRQELDAAFVFDVERRGGFIAMFVDSDETRQFLSPDLRSRRIPTLDNENYSRCLLELAALSWEALLRKKIAEANKHNNISILQLEKTIAEQELELSKLKTIGIIPRDEILNELKETNIELQDKSIKLREIFQFLSERFACGVTYSEIKSQTLMLFSVERDQHWEIEFNLDSKFLGKLIILGLVKVQPAAGEWSEIFYLTDLGKDIAFKLRSQSNNNNR